MKKMILVSFIILQLFVIQGTRAQVPHSRSLAPNGLPIPETSMQKTGTSIVQLSNIFDEQADTSGKYQKLRIDSFIYNSKHVFINEHVWHVPQSDTLWADSAQHPRVYDSSGRLICETQLVWDANTASFVTNFRDSFSYDLKNNTWAIATYQLQGGSFRYLQKDIHKMNGNGKDSAIVYQLATLQKNGIYTWHDIAHNYLSYNADGNLVVAADYYLDSLGHAQLSDLTTLYYNAAKQLIMDVDTEVTNNLVHGYERNYYYYNSSGLVDSVIRQYSYTPVDYFQNWTLFLYSYSTSYPGYVHQITEKKWNTANSSWVLNYRHTYNYLTYSTGIDVSSGAEDPSISIYPNPVSGFLTYSWPEVQNIGCVRYSIMDIAGKTVCQSNIIGAESMGHGQIYVQTLPAGAYILNLYAKDGSVSQSKFMKE